VTTDSFELTGAAAPPLANGELVFEEPWQGRVFGIARSLAERGLYSWDDFRVRLIAAIAQWERLERPDTQYRYYDCFLTALEAVLVERHLVAPGELRERVEQFEIRPHGHDHHDHDDDHVH
jgi:nitrile hydratase accessory protein